MPKRTNPNVSQMRLSAQPLTIFLLPAMVAGCSSTLPADIPPRPLRLEIQAGKVAEECFSLVANERI